MLTASSLGGKEDKKLHKVLADQEKEREHKYLELDAKDQLLKQRKGERFVKAYKCM